LILEIRQLFQLRISIRSAFEQFPKLIKDLRRNAHELIVPLFHQCRNAHGVSVLSKLHTYFVRVSATKFSEFTLTL